MSETGNSNEEMYDSMGPPIPSLPFANNEKDIEDESNFCVTVEYCPLCLGTKRALYCMVCVKEGNFSYSKKKSSAKKLET